MSIVSVVIVNFNTAELVINCLDSLANEISVLKDSHVIVVDNCSTDNSHDILNAHLASKNWSWVHLMKSEKNSGFAGGNNAALKKILGEKINPDYIYLLNPDTLCFPYTMTKLMEFLDAHTHVGIVGGRGKNLDHSDQVTAFRFHSILGEFESTIKFGPITRLLQNWTVPMPILKQPHACDWVSGCSMMFRRCLLNEIGLMDDTYFLYYEEVDYCINAKKKGWEIWHVPESKIIHLVGQSTGVGNKMTRVKRRNNYWFFSRNYYFVKNHGKSYALMANLSWLIGKIIDNVRKRFQKKTDFDPPYFMLDFIRHFFQPLFL